MINVEVERAASALLLKVAQTVEKRFVISVPTNATAAMNLAVVTVLCMSNVNMMGAKG